MFLIISSMLNRIAVNVLSKSRVWEIYKHGSVGAAIANELKSNLKEDLL
jgi:hypothetical protein